MNDYIHVSDEDRAQVIKLCGTDEESLKRDIGILKEWIKKQPHLPQDIQTDCFYEKVLLGSKCRVEKAKNSLDAYYTYRSIWPEMFKNLKNFKPKEASVCCIPLKQLTEKKERVVLVCFINDGERPHRFLDFVESSLASAEIVLKYDYCTGIQILIDYKNYTADNLLKILPDFFTKLEKISRQAYSDRVVGIEIFNTASWLTLGLSIVKPLLSQKMYNRIRVHDSMESVWNVCPKELLPKEYGGTVEFEKILDEFNECFLRNKQLFEETITVKSNENLRIGKCQFYEAEQFGLDGTFKKLNVD